MEVLLQKLKSELQERFNNSEIIVDDITFEKRDKYQFLTVVLDKVGGIDLNTIVDATHVVDEVVDKYDISDDSYILDVISKERG